MGFRTAHPASAEPSILLIAGWAQTGETGRLAESVDGADAALLRVAKSRLAGQAIPRIAASLPEIPWGVWLEDIDAKKLAALVEAGCDFVVFPASRLVTTTPRDDKVGKILQVEASLSEGMLKAINDLPVDAALVAGAYDADSATAWHHLMQFQRLASLLTKPLMVTVPSNVTAGELKALWETGVDGVVIEAGTGPAGNLKELRLAMSKLSFRPSRKRGKTAALLPYAGGEKITVTEDEEDGE